MVWKHLLFLAETVKSIAEAEIESFVSELQKTYEARLLELESRSLLQLEAKEKAHIDNMRQYREDLEQSLEILQVKTDEKWQDLFRQKESSFRELSLSYSLSVLHFFRAN